MDCYIQHIFSLVIILLFIIANICETWLKIKKSVLPYKTLKHINGFKKVRIKSYTCYYFDDIINIFI